MRSALRQPPLPCPRRMVSLAEWGAGQLKLAIVFTVSATLALSYRRHMPPIPVISSAGSFRRYHRCSQGIGRRAPNRECRAICGLSQSLQDHRADTFCRFIRADQIEIENPVSIKIGILVAETQAALRNHADAPPLLIRDFEDLAHDLLRGKIPLVAH